MDDLFLVQMLFKSRDDVVKGSYFLTPVESLEYMINTPAMQGDSYPGFILTDMTGVSPGTLLYFDRKENSVWYGGDGVGYIFLIRDGQEPLIWEVETYKDDGRFSKTGLRITKKDGPEDTWDHEWSYIYHKFYPLIQDYPVLMQLLNWFGTEWKKLLEASP
jgi:hypothetical protein